MPEEAGPTAKNEEDVQAKDDDTSGERRPVQTPLASPTTSIQVPVTVQGPMQLRTLPSLLSRPRPLQPPAAQLPVRGVELRDLRCPHRGRTDSVVTAGDQSELGSTGFVNGQFFPTHSQL